MVWAVGRRGVLLTRRDRSRKRFRYGGAYGLQVCDVWGLRERMRGRNRAQMARYSMHSGHVVSGVISMLPEKKDVRGLYERRNSRQEQKMHALHDLRGCTLLRVKRGALLRLLVGWRVELYARRLCEARVWPRLCRGFFCASGGVDRSQTYVINRHGKVPVPGGTLRAGNSTLGLRSYDHVPARPRRSRFG